MIPIHPPRQVDWRPRLPPIPIQTTTHQAIPFDRWSVYNLFPSSSFFRCVWAGDDSIKKRVPVSPHYTFIFIDWVSLSLKLMQNWWDSIIPFSLTFVPPDWWVAFPSSSPIEVTFQQIDKIVFRFNLSVFEFQARCFSNPFLTGAKIAKKKKKSPQLGQPPRAWQENKSINLGFGFWGLCERGVKIVVATGPGVECHKNVHRHQIPLESRKKVCEGLEWWSSLLKR